MSKTQLMNANVGSDNQVKRSVEKVASLMADPTIKKQLNSFEEQMKAGPHLLKQVAPAMLDRTLHERKKLVHRCSHCLQMEAMDGQEQMAGMRAASQSLVDLGQSFQPLKPAAALLGSRFREGGSLAPQAHGGSMPQSDVAYNFSSGARRALSRFSMMADPDTVDGGAKVRTLQRRDVLGLAALSVPIAASAEVDCLQDCLQNCARLAGGSKDYCKTTCTDYCAQDDRKDGLSGSVSSDGAEFGWASSFKNPLAPQKPSVYGSDKPPGLPDVFGINQALRKAVTGGDLTGGVEGQGGVK